MTDDESRRLLEQFGPCLPEAQGSVLKNAILKTLRKFRKPLSAKEIASYTQLNGGSVAATLCKMAGEGLIKRVARGIYLANE